MTATDDAFEDMGEQSLANDRTNATKEFLRKIEV